MSEDKIPKRESVKIIKSFLKEDTDYNAKIEAITFYQLFKQFPDSDFWRKYSLGFKLNSLLWFKSKEGQEKLTSDYAIFYLDLKEQFKDYKMESSKVGEDVEIIKKNKSLSDFLKK